MSKVKRTYEMSFDTLGRIEEYKEYLARKLGGAQISTPKTLEIMIFEALKLAKEKESK